VSVQAGFSGLTGKGFHKGAPPTKPTLIWQDLNENGQYNAGELIVSPGTSGQPSQNFSRYAVGADALVAVRYLNDFSTTVYAEFARANNLDRWFLVADPYGPIGRNLREWGYYVAAVQSLGPHFRLGLRYDHYNPDLDSTDRQAAVTVPSSQDISTVSAAVALVGRTAALSGRLVAEYDWISDHQGRNISGLPTRSLCARRLRSDAPSRARPRHWWIALRRLRGRRPEFRSAGVFQNPGRAIYSRAH
jgi:hypothetical protein